MRIEWRVSYIESENHRPQCVSVDKWKAIYHDKKRQLSSTLASKVIVRAIGPRDWLQQARARPLRDKTPCDVTKCPISATYPITCMYMFPYGPFATPAVLTFSSG